MQTFSPDHFGSQAWAVDKIAEAGNPGEGRKRETSEGGVDASIAFQNTKVTADSHEDLTFFLFGLRWIKISPFLSSNLDLFFLLTSAHLSRELLSGRCTCYPTAPYAGECSELGTM